MKPKFRHKQTVSLKIGNLGTTVCPSKEKVAAQTFMASDQHVTPSYVLDVIYKPADRFITYLCSIDHPLSPAHFNLLMVLFSRKSKTHPSCFLLTLEVFLVSVSDD